MDFKGFFTNCSLFELKSFCFCMQLKTGCYLIGLLYLAFGSLVFVEEISSAEYMFTYNLNMKYVAVLFAYDVMPTVMFIFSIFFLYGLYKEHLAFVFSSVSLICVTFILFILIFLDDLIRFHLFDLFYTASIFAIEVFLLLCLCVVKSYLNELSLKKNKKSHTLEERETTVTEFENPTVV